jgi:hypothetical protein
MEFSFCENRFGAVGATIVRAGTLRQQYYIPIMLSSYFFYSVWLLFALD